MTRLALFGRDDERALLDALVMLDGEKSPLFDFPEFDLLLDLFVSLRMQRVAGAGRILFRDADLRVMNWVVDEAKVDAKVRNTSALLMPLISLRLRIRDAVMAQSQSVTTPQAVVAGLASPARVLDHPLNSAAYR